MKRRRFQFTIRKLLWLTLIVALCLPFYGRVYIKHSTAGEPEWFLSLTPRWPHLSGLCVIAIVHNDCRSPSLFEHDYIAFYPRDQEIPAGPGERQRLPYALARTRRDGAIFWQRTDGSRFDIWCGDTAKKP
jgi:hypothetical protein